MNGRQMPFYGKYRGIVSSNSDPSMLGRVRAKVQDVLGSNESGWALPSVPYAGKELGFFALPPVGASVWIEFEHGDPDYPIWSGCFWAEGEVPAAPATEDIKILKTKLNTLTLSDVQGAGGITIETTISPGAKCVMNSQGIEISSGSGSIKFSAEGIEISRGSGSIKFSAQGVNINNGALEVM